MSAEQPKHVLIATVGNSPEVVTEVLDKLTGQGTHIDEVLVLHTNDDNVTKGKWEALGYFETVNGIEDITKPKGRKVRRKGLYKDPDCPDQPYLGQLFKPENSATPVLLRYPEEEQFHDPDINTEKENADFAKLLFSTILKERLDRGNDIYISIAGGRKTMSAYALLGAVLFGAKGVYHVLVSDKIEQSLREKGKFHVWEVLDEVKKEEDKKAYHLIPIPLPELRPLFSERPGPGEHLRQQLLDAKMLIDVVNKLADREAEQKKKGQIKYPIFHNNKNLLKPVSRLLNEEVQKALETQQDCFPRPWECLLVGGESPFKDIAEGCKNRFRIQTCSIDEIRNKLQVLSDTDLVVFDVPAGGEEGSEQIIPILRELRWKYPLLPTICLTQGRDVARSLRLTRAGATACIEGTEAYRIPVSVQSFFTASLPPDRTNIQVKGVDTWVQDVDEERRRREKDLREDLLRILFPEAKKIRVEPFLSATGRSSTSKGWVHLDEDPMPHFVKVGSPIELAQEKVSYETHVRGHLDNVAGRIEREIAFFELQSDDEDKARPKPQRAAIAYTAVGLPVSYLQAGRKPDSLGDFIKGEISRKRGKSESLKEVYNLLHQLFQDILVAWHDKKQKDKPLDPIQAYGHVFPPRLTLMWKGFVELSANCDLALTKEDPRQFDPQSWKEKEITILGQLSELDAAKHQLQLTHEQFGYKVSVRDVPDEVFASRKLHYWRTVGVSGTVCRTMEEVFEGRGLPGKGELVCGLKHPLEAFDEICRCLQASPQCVKWAPTHGDLNLDNVQTDGERLWLIDFARTKEGPIVFDFAKAEVELKVTLFDQLQGRSRAQLVQFENSLPAPAKNISSAGDELAALIACIRQHASGYCQEPPWDYYLALLVYSLASLKFEHTKPVDKDGKKGTADMLIASATVAGQKALEFLGKRAS